MIYIAHIKLYTGTNGSEANVQSEKLLISAINASNALDILGGYAGSKELEIEWFKKVGDENNENVVSIATKINSDNWTESQEWQNINAGHGLG